MINLLWQVCINETSLLQTNPVFFNGDYNIDYVNYSKYFKCSYTFVDQIVSFSAEIKSSHENVCDIIFN